MEGRKKIHKKDKSYTVYILLTAVIIFVGISPANADSVIIENNVSATANTGGNVVEGGGEIQAGNASAAAESSVKTNTSSEGKTKIDAKAEATANGKTETKEVHKEIKGNVSENVQVEASSGSDESGVEIKTKEEEQKEADSLDGQNTSEENKNFFISVAENISSAIKGIFDSMILFFG